MSKFVISAVGLLCLSCSLTSRPSSALFDTKYHSAKNSLRKEGWESLFQHEIEYSRNVRNRDGGKDFVYAAFSENAGYMILDDEGVIRGYGDSGQLLPLREANDPSFDGLDFYEGDQKIETKKNLWSDDYVIGDPVGSIGAQFTSKIEYGGIDYYLQQKYAPVTYVLSESGKLSGLSTGCNSNGYTAIPESVYLTANGTSEGNCGIVSTSNALAYYSEFGGYSGLPSRTSTTLVLPQLDPFYFYTQYFNPPYYPKSAPVIIHTIPAKVREKAIAAGYEVSGMNDTKTETAYVQTCATYGYSGSFTPYTTYSYAQIKNWINSGKALQFRTAEDVAYGGHGMFVTGYRKYNVMKYVGPLLASLDLVFLSVYDGHSQNERWYDLTYLSNVGSEYNRATSQTIALYGIQ